MTGRHIFQFALLTGILLFSAIPSFAQPQPKDNAAYETLSYYFDLLATGNVESALGIWEPRALARATRLGINYDNIIIKADCNSPVIFDFERSRGNLNPGIQSVAVIDSGVIRLKIAARVADTSFDYFYHLQKIGKDYWLIYPQDYYSGSWPVSESKYFRFHINPDMASSSNPIAIQSLDDFVDSTGRKIGITPERLSLLATQKIDYYFCQGEGQVGTLSGRIGKGYYDLGADAIITSIFPHYHEVAHLLVNFKLQNLPIFTVPFMQEGTAVYLGGRWQRAPDVMIDFGKYILDNGITEIDSVLLESENASSPSADIAFPVTACLADYLCTTLGNEKFFALYKNLSGNYTFVSRLKPDSVKQLVTGFAGKNWTELMDDFKKYLGSRKGATGRIFPGDVATDKVLISDSGVVLSKSNKWLKIECTASGDERVDINVLFNQIPELKDKLSSIFYEQYRQTRPFLGYRYGLKLDKNEIGLYDYATNQLKAKYVYDFAPDPAYYDSTRNKFTAYFDINLLGKVLPAKSDYMILKQ
ncbi:MAG: hypothetical protein NT002_05355 [candidate division Zixibacteria bacterium]|nr:hypothetical protein [candidate division Zixibacteria bacterium]